VLNRDAMKLSELWRVNASGIAIMETRWIVKKWWHSWRRRSPEEDGGGVEKTRSESFPTVPSFYSWKLEKKQDVFELWGHR
jgi:hypothetical protein